MNMASGEADGPARPGPRLASSEAMFMLIDDLSTRYCPQQVHFHKKRFLSWRNPFPTVLIKDLAQSDLETDLTGLGEGQNGPRNSSSNPAGFEGLP